MENLQQEGFWKTCPRCRGAGTESQTQGFFNPKEVKVDCELCHGERKIFFVSTCPVMTARQFYFSSQNTSVLEVNCLGEPCALWDRDNGGGCLWRKSLLQSAHGKV